VAVVRVDAAGGDDACAVEAADVRHERLAALDDRRRVAVHAVIRPRAFEHRPPPVLVGRVQAAT
jgi:hypothetical protein